MPPTFLSIDISLSFKIIIIFLFRYPKWFIASKAIPPVIEPSPITETTLKSSLFISLAHAIPSPTEIDVELCPVSNISCSLSFSFGNPLNPSSCLSVLKSSLRPVIILCTYDWCPTSHINLSFGLSKTLCNAKVNSTTPKFEAKWPPVFEIDSIKNCLISSANSSISFVFNFFISSGEFTLFK